MNMRRASSLTVAGALVVAAIAGYGLWHRNNGTDGARYVTESVDRGPISSVVTATGAVNPVSTVQVGTYVSGPILAIDVDYNSPVIKGQRVAKIDPAAFQVKVFKAEASVANARAKVEKSRADLELKKLTLHRNLELGAKNLIAQHEVDTARSGYDQAIAQLALDAAAVKQSQAELDEARINLAYTDIRSPVDGVVVSRSVDVGQTVAASFQTPTLFLIAQDLTKMQVDANVSESDIGDIHPDLPAVFTVDAYPGKQFQGTVIQVRNAPITVQNVVTYDVVIAVDNSTLLLKPGMTATVSITTAERDDAIRVPLRALRFAPEREATPGSQPRRPRPAVQESTPTVWVVQPDGALREVAVDIGLRDDRFGELRSNNLQVGDPLAVAYRAAQKKDGQRPPGVPRFR